MINKGINKNSRNQKKFEVNDMRDKSMDCIVNEKKNKKGDTNTIQNIKSISSKKKLNKQIQPSKSKLNLFNDNESSGFKKEFCKPLQTHHKNE